MVFVLTALVAMNGEAQNAAREPGLYADDAFIGDANLSEAADTSRAMPVRASTTRLS